MIIFRSSLKHLKEFLYEEGFWRINHLGDPEIERKQKRIYNIIATAFKVNFIFGVFMFIIAFSLPIITQERKLPLLCYHPVDFFAFPTYELIYVWQFMNCWFIMTFVMSMSGIFFSSISFGYCQTMMLKEAIRNLDMENLTTEDDEKRCFEKMKEYIQYHSKLLQ